MTPLRLLFFGTPDVAVPTLERLIAGPHEVVGVVSQPDRARGRGRKTSPSPVSAIAIREDIPLLRPERVGDEAALETMRAMRPDLGIVVAFGQFLPKKVRELPTCGYLINAHASLLPKYRGASPIASAILDGEASTGVSVMRVEKEMDSGAVALVRETPIRPRENTLQLTERLAVLAADAIEEAVDQIARDEIAWTEQDEALVTIAPKLEKADADLDLREPARALANRVHALAPKPGARISLESPEASDVEALPLKILEADVDAFESAGPAPGTIELAAGNAALRIATGDGWLVPLVVQRAGGKPMPVDAFLRGFAIEADMRCALTNSTGTGGDS